MNRYFTIVTIGLALLALVTQAGCTTVKDTYDRWFGASVPAAKPAELVQIRPVVTPKIAWQSTVGAAEKTVFFPSVSGNTVWATGAAGHITAFAANTGAVTTKFEAGQRIASGVAAGGALVVVGTARGELLAFSNAGKACNIRSLMPDAP